MAINSQAIKARLNGIDIFHFGFGQSPFPVHESIRAALKDNVHQKDYLPTFGLRELREQIRRFHQAHFSYDFIVENICIGPGSKELIFQILYILEGPIYVPAPSWVSYGPQANLRGKKIHEVITSVENSYKLQADELEDKIIELGEENLQKTLILNNPSNPTGAVYTDQEVKDLAQVCKKYKIIVISDEIYSLINFSKRKYVGFLKYLPDQTIVSSGISKSHGAGGYRLGFMAIPKALETLVRPLAAMVSETFSAVSAPIQFAGVAAYQKDEKLEKSIQNATIIHELAGNYLAKRFIDMGLRCPIPEGAFYLFPDFQKYKAQLEEMGIKDSVELSKYLFKNYQVALLPGCDFYYPTDYFGLRVATVDYNGEEALKGLEENQKIDFDFIRRYCPSLIKGADQIELFLTQVKQQKN